MMTDAAIERQRSSNREGLLVFLVARAENGNDPTTPTALMHARKSNKETRDNIESIEIVEQQKNEGKRPRLLRRNMLGAALVVLLMVVVLSTTLEIVPQTQAFRSSETIVIPECPSSPWKPNEDLVGTCPGDLKQYSQADTAVACAQACCASDECVTWQFRRDVGCKHGPDVRIGMEKDGPSAYCSAHPPYQWNGQFVLTREDGQIVIDGRREKACSKETWDPYEQQGQCFGLGDVRSPEASKNAEGCMEACCSDDTCGAWQWQKDLGCFYGKRMFSCTKSDDPVVFEPFVGRRKLQPSRTYRVIPKLQAAARRAV